MVATPLPVVPDAIKFTVEGTCGATKWVNALHWGYSGTAPTGTALNAFCTALLDAWATNFAALIGTDCQILRSTAIDLASTSGAGGEVDVTTTGTSVGAAVPASAAVVVSKVIARRYRGGHPRSYVVAGTVADLDDPSHWNAALVIAVGSAYNAVATAVDGQTSGGCTLTTEVNVSYFTGLARRVTPVVDPVTGILVRARLGTQRNRLGR